MNNKYYRKKKKNRGSSLGKCGNSEWGRKDMGEPREMAGEMGLSLENIKFEGVKKRHVHLKRKTCRVVHRFTQGVTTGV